MTKQEFTGYSPSCLQDVQRRLAEVDATPNEKIGQHFLVNQGAIDLLAQTVNPEGTVIEVGCGIGHVTERLAERASRLHGIEIDRRYRPLLDKITSDYRNVFITYGDALTVNFNRLLYDDKQDGEVVASLPYHIIEPFIQKIAPLPLSSVTLVVGRQYADSLTASISSSGFGRLSILTSTFFDTETLAAVQRDGFFPIPRTDSAVIQLRPRDAREIGSNRRDVVFRHLFLTSRHNSTLRKGLKEGFDMFEQSRDGLGLSKRERNRKSRINTKRRLREALGYLNRSNIADEDLDPTTKASLISNISRSAIDKLGIPPLTLDKPFGLLNNSELTTLYIALG